MKVYANGVLAETWNHGNVAHYGSSSSLQKIHAGGRVSGQDDSLGFEGKLDEISVWTTALSAAEVQSLYNTTCWQ